MTLTFDHTEDIISSVDFLLVEKFDLEDPELDDQLDNFLQDLPQVELERAILEDIAA